MKIWIDGYEANVPQRLGSNQVAFELLKNLEKIDKVNDYTILLPEEPLQDMPGRRQGWEYKIVRPKKLWTRIALPLSLFCAKEKPDIFFSPTHYTPRFSPVKRVMMVFDLAFLHYPEMFMKRDYYKLKKWTEISVKNADKIITISQSSKRDLVKVYKLNPKKITVSYPGYDQAIFYPREDKEKVNKVLSRYNIYEPFIIFIGTVQPRKNLKRLIEVFKRIENLKLVIVGKTLGPGRKGWMYEDILEMPKRLGIEERVIFTGFVPTCDLPYLLSSAKAYVLPSLYEGFGIPIVEAMACGIPVIVSNTSSLPEVVGKNGLLIDPQSNDQMEQAIRIITVDKKLWIKLSKASLKRAKFFSWVKMAKEVKKVLEES